jgi:serine palmitoyltransferase
MMDLETAHSLALSFLDKMGDLFQRVPGSAIFLRYVKSSYQNDPVRSAVELFLFLFAVRYLLAPKYSTQKMAGNFVKLSDREIDELVEDWTPEPLVATQTEFEAAENEKRPVIVGYVTVIFYMRLWDLDANCQKTYRSEIETLKWPHSA